MLPSSWLAAFDPSSAGKARLDGQTSESFAYRCLPLNIANSHGWQLLNPAAFDACWSGESDTAGITIRPTAEGAIENVAVSLFGQGILTFHVPGIFRTPAGWNLWVTGTPNEPKDGIYSLTAVIETDWSPFTFTMNWRFTRPNRWIHFGAGEPICFFFPVQRALLEDIDPAMLPIDAEPRLWSRFQEWSKERDAFVLRMANEPPVAPADKWQKHYYRGVDTSEKQQIADHCTRLRLKPFKSSAISWPLEQPTETRLDVGPMISPAAAEIPALDQDLPRSPSQTLLDLRKREWLLDMLERQRSLSPQQATIERRAGLSSEEFLDRYYAANRPVILTDEMADWAALTKWTPDYLKRAVGNKTIEFQGDRSKSDRFEIYKDKHRREMPFDQFIDLVTSYGAGNDAYLTAFNSTRNIEALSALQSDLGFPKKFLDNEVEQPKGMMWIGPAGTLTSLHHDLTNNLIAQVVGRKRLIVLPASEVGKVYNHLHVFSDISDLEDPALTLAQYPNLEHARFTEVTLMPGEMIFMPLAWWHQVRSIDFSVTVTYTNFRWPNDGYKTFPQAE